MGNYLLFEHHQLSELQGIAMALCLLSGAARPAAAQEIVQNPNIILVVFDGCGYDGVNVCGSWGRCHRALRPRMASAEPKPPPLASLSGQTNFSHAAE